MQKRVIQNTFNSMLGDPSTLDLLQVLTFMTLPLLLSLGQVNAAGLNMWVPFAGQDDLSHALSLFSTEDMWLQLGRWTCAAAAGSSITIGNTK